MEVKRAGGVAAILGNPFNEIKVTPYLDPTTVVFSYSLATILTYIRTEKNPMATLVPGNTLIGTKPAPVMASFTSKGPNVVDPNILKVTEYFTVCWCIEVKTLFLKNTFTLNCSRI